MIVLHHAALGRVVRFGGSSCVFVVDTARRIVLLHTTGAADGIKNGAEAACKMRVLSRSLVTLWRLNGRRPPRTGAGR